VRIAEKANGQGYTVEITEDQMNPTNIYIVHIRKSKTRTIRTRAIQTRAAKVRAVKVMAI
jgi:hypothetical protein